MALLELYWDVKSRKFIKSIYDTSEFSFGTLSQEDVYSFVVYPVKVIDPTLQPAAAFIGASGYSFKIALGDEDNPLATVTLSTVTDDGNGITGATLNLNTPGINNLAADAQIELEGILYSATETFRGSQQVAIRKSVLLASSVVEVPSDTALGKNEAEGIYIPRSGTTSILLVSQDGTKSARIYLDNDGTVRIPGIT
jgi:hypothetical protein